MNKLKTDALKLIEKYIGDTADEDEIRMIESFFANGEDKYELKRLLEKDWDEIRSDSSQNREKLINLLDRIHHVISMNEYKRKNTFLYKAASVFARVAAILILPLIITSIILYKYGTDDNRLTINKAGEINKEYINKESVTSTIIAPLGARVAFMLPDSTSGMLNSGSRLTYSIPFSANRHVSLEGEAWFDVTDDINNPFEISAGNSKVKVLGTSFNISAYPAENYIEVVLSNGKVEFSDNITLSKVTMLPSERLVLHNGSISKSITDPAKYNAWTEGKLMFRGDLMTEVGRRIERWYNVKIELADRDLEKYSFRGTFEDDTLEEVLEFLSMTSPISYKIEPRKQMADGTYQKEKVIIYLRE